MFYDKDDLYTTEYAPSIGGWVVMRINGGKSKPVAIGSTEREAMDNWKRENLYNHVVKH